jgi:5-keto 4-deoxyuronate isomerase
MRKLDDRALELIEEFNKNRTLTFAEYISSLFKDQFIEIYVGDCYEDVKFEQHSTQYPAVFCGKVVGAFKECLIISAAYSDGKDIKLGKLMFISERAIRTLSPVDGKGTLQDMFLRSRESLAIAKKFG